MCVQVYWSLCVMSRVLAKTLVIRVKPPVNLMHHCIKLIAKCCWYCMSVLVLYAQQVYVHNIMKQSNTSDMITRSAKERRQYKEQGGKI